MVQSRFKFVIVDDHPLFRGALRQALADLSPGLEIAEAGSLDEVTTLLGQDDEIDLVLLDLSMPGVKGFSGLMYLRAEYPTVPVIVVSANEDPTVMRRCIGFGASGYIPKSLPADIMRTAIKRVLKGDVFLPAAAKTPKQDDGELAALLEKFSTLTPQQMRVLMMLSEGMLNKQIAHHFDVSEATVKAHVSAILQKLGVESRTQAVLIAKKLEEEHGIHGAM